VKVRNPSFDVTPAELVSAIITEKGIVPSPNADSLRALFD
jgi:methylthioribose-1-phosphate isomerase